MCGLFGFCHYGENEIKHLDELTNTLAVESAVRGTDATGVAYNAGGKLNIIKDSKSAYAMDFKHPDSVKVVMGHTRTLRKAVKKRIEITTHSTADARTPDLLLPITVCL